MLMHDILSMDLRNGLIPHACFLICFSFFTFVQDIKVTDDHTSSINDAGHDQLVEVQKKESIIEKSLDKIKETSTV